MGKSNKFWSWLENANNLWGLLGIVGLSSGGGAVVTYLNELPIWVPVILGIIAVGLIAISIIKIIIKHQQWKATLEERKKTIEEKRVDILAIPETLRIVADQQLIIVKALIEKGVTEGMMGEIIKLIRQRMKLPDNMIPSTMRKDIETTFKIMKKLKIKTSKPENIIRTGLLFGWILDEKKVGIRESETSLNNEVFQMTQQNFNTKQLTKVCGGDLEDAITMFNNVLRAGDSAYLAMRYLVGPNDKAPDELQKYDASLPEFEYTREMEIESALIEIRRLTEKECEFLGE